jgi:hypothetical protein
MEATIAIALICLVWGAGFLCGFHFGRRRCEHAPADRLTNMGVFKAIEYAFRCRDFPIDRDSEEYGQIKEAYWDIVWKFDPNWRDKQGKPFPPPA